MKAYPTMYRGVQMRSRLEARYACWFDLKGDTTWEYEPFDLEGYVPAFILHFEGIAVIAEAKPVYRLDAFLRSFDGYKTWLGLSDPALGDDFRGFMLLGAMPNHCWFLPQGAGKQWEQMPAMTPVMLDAWKEAGNVVQWKSPASKVRW